MYHYGGNNPVRYVDPDGRDINDVDTELVMSSAKDRLLNTGPELIKEKGCVLTAYARIANAVGNKTFSLADANERAVALDLFNKKNELTPQAGARLINSLLQGTGKSVTFAGSIYPESLVESGSFLNSLENSYSELYVTARIDTYDETGTENYGHTVNINSNSVIAGDILDISNALNIRINDTSGVRSQVMNDVRRNKILRIDYFRVN